MHFEKENLVKFRIGRFLWAGIFLICLTLIFCWRLIFVKGVFFGIDMVFFYPMRTFILNAIKSGIFPLWNPYVFCGAPLSADSATWGIFYPLNIIFLFLPLDIAFNIMVILHIFLAGISMYVFMRLLEIESFPSIISAITFMFSKYIITMVSTGMLELFNAITWIPLLFMLFREALNKGSIAYCIGGGIVFGIQALTGHPQVTLFTSYILFSYFLFYLFSTEKKGSLVTRFKKSFKIIILIFVIGAGLSAIQLFPALEYFLGFSLRKAGVTYDFASSYSLPPKHLITYFLPDIFNNSIKGYYWGAMNFDELSTYIGILPLFLAGYAVCFSTHKERSYFGVLGLVSLFLAFGKYSFIHEACYKFLPGFNLFRCPARWLIFTTFSFSILAGLGVSELAKRKDIKRVMFKLAKGLTLCCIVFTVVLAMELYFSIGVIKRLVVFLSVSEWGRQIPLTIKQYDVELSLLKSILICGITAGGLAFICFKNLPQLITKIFIVILIFFDLYFFCGKFVFTTNPDVYLANNLWNIIKADSGFYRVVTVPPVGIFGAIAKEISCFEGGTGDLMTKDYNDFRSNVPQWMDLMSGRYILTTTPIKESRYRYIGEDMTEVIEPYRFDHVYRTKMRVRLYEKDDVLPKVFTVHRSRVVNSHDEVLTYILNPSFNPRQEIVLEEPVIDKDVETIPFKSDEDNITIVKYSPNRIVVEVDFKSNGFLVMTEVFYPGWKVFIDKKSTKLYRANYIMRGVYVDKGMHEVVFQYVPISFKIGVGITLFTIGCIIFLIIRKPLISKFNLVFIMENRRRTVK